MKNSYRQVLMVCSAGAAFGASAQPINPKISIGGKDEIWNDRGKVSEVDYKLNPGDTITHRYTGIELGYTGSGVGDVDGDTLNDFAATYYWHDYPFSNNDLKVIDPAENYTLPWPYHGDSGSRDFPAGDVRVFGHNGSAIAQIGGALRHRDPIYAGRFAHVIRGRADVDGDGRDDIIAGSGVTGGISVWAYTDRYTGTEEWVQLLRFREPQTCWDRESTYSNGSANAHLGTIQRFGWTVTECTDMNGDGSPDIIVGAKGYDELHPYLRGDGISGETPSESPTWPRSEGAVLVYCMPLFTWWSKFRAPYIENGNGVIGEYWLEYVDEKHIDPTTGYDGEPLVDIDSTTTDVYYNIRITDPSYTHEYLSPTTNTEHKSYLDADERQWEFGSAVRVADDLDGDGEPDIVATGYSHLHDHDSDPVTDPVRTGKVYVYLSSSGVRDNDETPSNTFQGLSPLVHGVWEHQNGKRLNAPSTAGEQLDIEIGEADVIIVGPPPTAGVTYGIESVTAAITEVMPYNTDSLDDILIGCTSKLDGNTNNGFAAFFEIEKRIREETSNGTCYPIDPVVWQIPHNKTYAADSSGLYPDRYLSVDTGNFNGVSMAGNVDKMGKCDIRMSLHAGSSGGKDLICAYNPYRIRDGLIGNFETVWEIHTEPTSYAAPTCDDPADHMDGVTIGSVSYPKLEPYEYALPDSGTGSDQVAAGDVSKDISRWWWTGDVDGDTFGDLLGAAWSYPAHYESGGDVICDPVSGGTSIDLFRAGKVYLFPSPFNVANNGEDEDIDGVNDAVDSCVSVADINENGSIDSSDSAWATYLIPTYNGVSESSNYELYMTWRMLDIDRDGTIENPEDYNAFVTAANLGCQ